MTQDEISIKWRNHSMRDVAQRVIFLADRQKTKEEWTEYKYLIQAFAVPFAKLLEAGLAEGPFLAEYLETEFMKGEPITFEAWLQMKMEPDSLEKEIDAAYRALDREMDCVRQCELSLNSGGIESSALYWLNDALRGYQRKVEKLEREIERLKLVIEARKLAKGLK